MLSEDFALAGELKRKWEDWYKDEIVNNELFKTLFFKYKGQLYQFEPIGYDVGKKAQNKTIKDTSYIFERIKESLLGGYEVEGSPICFDSFKDAIDKAIIFEDKTFKDIWDDPESEYIDFL